MSNRGLKKLKKNQTEEELEEEDLETQVFNQYNTKKKKKKKPKANIPTEITETIDESINIDDLNDEELEELERKLQEEEEEIKKLEEELKVEEDETNQPEKDEIIQEEIEEEKEDINFKNQSKKKKKKKKKQTDDDFLIDKIEIKPEEIKKEKEVSILEIKVSNLNPDNEIKKIFGSNVLRSQKKKITRTTYFVTPKDHWPPYKNPGLEMKLINSDVFDTFELVYSPEYLKIEEKFKFCVESHDPNNLMELLHHHPYHINTLLQLVEVFIIQNDVDQANDLIERSLFALEATWGQVFFKSACKGNAFLPVEKNSNFMVYASLVKRIHSIGKTGCNKTAIELSKFLYGLDKKNDPFHVCLFIDYYCNRSGNYDFLLKFIEHQTQFGLNSLPNFLFGKAFALHKLNDKTASSILQHALLLFPMALPILIDKAKWDIGKWNPIITDTYFTDLVCTSKLFSSLISISIERNAEIWDKDIQFWVMDNVKLLINLLKSKDGEKMMKDYDKVRNDVYIQNCFNPYKNVTLAEIQGNVLPSQELNLDSQSSIFGANAILQFFSTLLPWNNHEELYNQNIQEEE
eukprot:gene5897-9725_t